MDEFREYLINKYIEIYNRGVSSALVEIARIKIATDDELMELAKDRGFKPEEWEKQ